MNCLWCLCHLLHAFGTLVNVAHIQRPFAPPVLPPKLDQLELFKPQEVVLSPWLNHGHPVDPWCRKLAIWLDHIIKFCRCGLISLAADYGGPDSPIRPPHCSKVWSRTPYDTYHPIFNTFIKTSAGIVFGLITFTFTTFMLTNQDNTQTKRPFSPHCGCLPSP